MARKTKREIDEACQRFTTLTSEQLAWLVGLCEGEGCFYVQKAQCYRKVRGGGRKAFIYQCPAFKLAMTDEDVVAGAANLLGYKHTGPHYNNGDQYKPIYILTFGGEVAMRFCDLVYPHLGTRRRIQIDTLREADKNRLTPMNQEGRAEE